MPCKNVHVKDFFCTYIPFLSTISLLLRKAAEPSKRLVKLALCQTDLLSNVDQYISLLHSRITPCVTTYVCLVTDSSFLHSWTNKTNLRNALPDNKLLRAILPGELNWVEAALALYEGRTQLTSTHPQVKLIREGFH